MGWFWSQQWIKKGTPISWYWHWDKHYSIVLGSFCSICIRHGQNIVGDCIYPYTTRGGRRCLALSVWKWTRFGKKFVQSFRFQPDKGSCWIVTCFSVTGKASPDNKSCIVLGLLSVDFFSGVAWLTGSSSMVGRPSEDQPCDLNRKWK